MPTRIDTYLPPLEAELRSWVPDGGPARGLYDMIRYHLGWADADGTPSSAPAGKMVRPILCLLICDGFAGDFRPALPAAAGVELLHNFTLVHDDIQDRSAERRHRATVWRIWGEAQAINVGDTLYSLSHLAVLGAAERGAPAMAVARAARTLDRACQEICEGQYLDLEFERRLDVTTEQYLAMIRRKTAVLLGCACELGALLGGADASGIAAARQLGETMGLAYQIQDDYLGIWGDPEVTGKPAADDIRNRKKTLPILLAWERADPTRADALRAAFDQRAAGECDVDAIIRVLEGSGARTDTEREARRLYQETLSLSDLPGFDPECRDTLRSLIASLLRRDS